LAGMTGARPSAREFLMALFPEWPADTWAELRAFEPGKKDGLPKQREWVRTVTALLGAAARLSANYEVYFGVNLRRGKNGTKADVAAVNCAHCDLDLLLDEARKALDTFELPPTAVVASGHGAHAYWLLREPYTINGPKDTARMDAINRGLSRAFQDGDKGAWDISRVLRVPGTANHKNGATLPVELVEFHPDRRYNPSEFERLGYSLPPGAAADVAFTDAYVDAEAALQKAHPLSSEVRRLITEGHPAGADRSVGDYRVCCDLVRAGLSDDEIRAVFTHYPIGAKYAESGDRYLSLTLGKARADVATEAKAKSTPVEKSAVALPFHTGEEIGREVPAEVGWVAKPWVAAGSLSELTARVKGGKTTWITHLCRCVLDGVPFMGEPTTKGAVVYLTEQPKASFRKALERADLLRPDFYVLYKREVIGVPWPDVVKGAIAKAREVGAVLLVTDTLSKFADLPGDMENASGAALEAVEPLEQAAAEGLGVFILRHERKSGGEVGMSGRGSSAFGGAVDTVLRLRRGEGNSRPTVRVIDGLSRFDEVPDSLVIDWPEGPEGQRRYVALGSEGTLARSNAEEAILALLPTSEDEAIPRTSSKEDVPTIDKGLPKEIRPTAITEALQSLLASGKAERIGTGGRGHPYRYWRQP